MAGIDVNEVVRGSTAQNRSLKVPKTPQQGYDQFARTALQTGVNQSDAISLQQEATQEALRIQDEAVNAKAIVHLQGAKQQTIAVENYMANTAPAMGLADRAKDNIIRKSEQLEELQKKQFSGIFAPFQFIGNEFAKSRVEDQIRESAENFNIANETMRFENAELARENTRIQVHTINESNAAINAGTVAAQQGLAAKGFNAQVITKQAELAETTADQLRQNAQASQNSKIQMNQEARAGKAAKEAEAYKQTTVFQSILLTRDRAAGRSRTIEELLADPIATQDAKLAIEALPKEALTSVMTIADQHMGAYRTGKQWSTDELTEAAGAVGNGEAAQYYWGIQGNQPRVALLNAAVYKTALNDATIELKDMAGPNGMPLDDKAKNAALQKRTGELMKIYRERPAAELTESYIKTQSGVQLDATGNHLNSAAILGVLDGKFGASALPTKVQELLRSPEILNVLDRPVIDQSRGTISKSFAIEQYLLGKGIPQRDVMRSIPEINRATAIPTLAQTDPNVRLLADNGYANKIPISLRGIRGASAIVPGSGTTNVAGFLGTLPLAQVLPNGTNANPDTASYLGQFATSEIDLGDSASVYRALRAYEQSLRLSTKQK